MANSIAHGEPPLGIARVILWQCEECGGRIFQVLVWYQWAGDCRTTNNRFALRCLTCGRVEANMTVSIRMW